MEIDFQKAGTFSIGCNYWASHAGTNMWHDWDLDAVKKDFKQLAGSGLHVVRVFPLWPDFQPIQCIKGCAGHRMEMRMGEDSLGHDELGRAGVSKLMMDRFKLLADEAAKNKLKVIVGLVTGWMSGRLYVPPAFENIDVISDPYAIMWQIKFVKAFVRHFKGHKAIAAWEYGNECNCMGKADSREAAYLWASSLADAMRSCDSSRPVISGMHSLTPEQGSWRIQDQGEISDVLTTHPYPIFTPHCGLDPVNAIRNALHATAESRLYADIGGKPCMVEEIGTLGPMICSEEVSAAYARMSMLSSYANDCRSFLWWCAYDQDHLAQAPYDWNSVERELGIFRKDRKPKPLASALKDFSSLLDKLPVLPPQLKEAVCILTKGQDQWGAAYSSYVLAKQAGFDIEFQYIEQELKDSKLYLLPSLSGGASMRRESFQKLLAKVKAGAHLYMSIGDALLSPFNEIAGLKVLTREKRASQAVCKLDCAKGVEFKVGSSHKLAIETAGAKVLGVEADGNPCFTSVACGKGRIYVLTVPIEAHLSATPGAFHSKGALPFWKVYELLAKDFVSARALVKGHPMAGATEHPLPNGDRIVFLLNHSPEDLSFEALLKPQWKLKGAIRGKLPAAAKGSLKLNIPANDALIFKISK